MTGLDLAGKRVLIRQDLNVPVKDGKVASDQRIKASLPTIRHCLEQGACVMIMSHLGRPTEGEPAAEFSLQPVADYLSDAWVKTVPLVVITCNSHHRLTRVRLCCWRMCVLTRVKNPTMKHCHASMPRLCDIYVMDAFGTAHRAQASTHGAGQFAPVACAGPAARRRTRCAGQGAQRTGQPGGGDCWWVQGVDQANRARQLSEKVDQLIPGGGIANTFIAAAGYNVGKSLVETDLIPEAQRLMEQAKAKGGEIPIPVDVVCGKEFSADTPAEVKAVDAVATTT